MDATWQDDIWSNTFDIHPDGKANVTFEITMAVPLHQPRPIDYLNFGLWEDNFKAYDVFTNEPLTSEEIPREKGKTVRITPNHELQLGEKYQYKLNFRQSQGLIKQLTEDCFVLEWGWGNWPLEYTLKFILPKGFCVYYASGNLIEAAIEDGRPVLKFKDRSEHNTSIYIQAMMHLSEKSFFEFIDLNQIESDPHVFKVCYDIEKNSNVEVQTKIRSKRCVIDIPMTFLEENYSHLAIYEGKTKDPLKYRMLPIFWGGEHAIFYLRIYAPIEWNKISQLIYCLDFRILKGLVSKFNNVNYTSVILGGIQAIWDLTFSIPRNTNVFFVSPAPVKSYLQNNRPTIFFKIASEAFSTSKIEILFKNAMSSSIELKYRFIELEIPKHIEKDSIQSIPFIIRNTTPKTVDIFVEAELFGFEENIRSKQFVAIEPGDSRKTDFLVSPHKSASKGYIRITVYAGNNPPEITSNYEIIFVTPSDDKKNLCKHAFISYSHKDKNWFERIKIMLKPLEFQKIISIWDYTKIKPGEKWFEETEKVLTSAKVAVLLVSPNFLASDFIMQNELPYLLEAAENKKLKIFWIHIKLCYYEETPIAKFQSVSDPSKPLDELSEIEQNRELHKLCSEIKRALDIR